MSSIHELYVGIDSHSRTHKVALIRATALQSSPKVEGLERIGVNRHLQQFKRFSAFTLRHSKIYKTHR